MSGVTEAHIVAASLAAFATGAGSGLLLAWFQRLAREIV